MTVCYLKNEPAYTVLSAEVLPFASKLINLTLAMRASISSPPKSRSSTSTGAEVRVVTEVVAGVPQRRGRDDMIEKEDHETRLNDGAIDKVAVYLCGVAAQHELGETDVRIYHSAERLKRARGHWNCGIAEYEMRFVRWVDPQGDLREGGTRLGDVEVTRRLIADTEALIAKRQDYLERLKLELQRGEAKTLHLGPDTDY